MESIDSQLDFSRKEINQSLNAVVGDGKKITRIYLDKLKEELKELEIAIDSNDLEEVRSELGDVLFVADSLSMSLGYSRDKALLPQVFKHMFRYHNGYDYINKKYPAGANLKEVESEIMKSAEIIFNNGAVPSLEKAYSVASTINKMKRNGK